MSEYLYRGRNFGANKRARPHSIGPMMDFSCDETDKGPPVQMHSLREFEQHLNDLKKENFSLKLRIYFLEEKVQQKFEESSDDVHKRNIELKVEVESLKNELDEKQQLLDKALSRAESLTNQNEAELQRRLGDRQEEISHMQEILQTKVQLLQEEAELSRAEAQRSASLADSSAQRCLVLEREMVEREEEERGGFTHTHSHHHKDRLIEDLSQQNVSLTLRLQELEVDVHTLSSSLEERERDYERLLADQTDILSQYGHTAGQCVGEKAQEQVSALQAKVRERDSKNQQLQQRLSEMEMELHATHEDNQRQERNNQRLSETVNTKEAQATELYRVIEEQNKMLCSLKELSNRSQLQVSGSDSVRGEVVALQSSLFQAQLESQSSQRAHTHAAVTQDHLNRVIDRLETDLQGALEHRRDTHRHNQDLLLALEKATSALQEREDEMKEREMERRRVEEGREKTITELKTALLSKEQFIQDCELLEDPQEKKDSLLQKLRQRIRERDRALERCVDEKFRCVEQKEEETRRLQLLLRERERDAERQRCVLDHNQDTITSLEVLLRGKALELDQVCDSWRNIQSLQQETDETHQRTVRERDHIIGQLQGALGNRTQEAQEMRSSLLSQIQSAPRDFLEELKLRLQLKDRLFQEVMSDRTRQSQQHQETVQGLITTIAHRDQYIQDSAMRLGEVMCEQTSRLQALRGELSPRSELPGWASERAVSDPSVELQALHEELGLALRREAESQQHSRDQAAMLEGLSRTLTVKEETIRDFQKQLVEPAGLSLVERLTVELEQLREALFQQDLPPVRGPILGRDRQHRQPESGDLSSEDDDDEDNDDDDDLNSEFTESIDEDESKARVQSAANTKASLSVASKELLFEGQGLMEVKHLVKQQKAVERELGELKAQLEKAGFSSLSQMRKALFSLQAENEDLKQQLTDRMHADEHNQVSAGEEEEDECDVTVGGAEEEEESCDLWDAWDTEHTLTHHEPTELAPSHTLTHHQPLQTHTPNSQDCLAGSDQGLVSSLHCDTSARRQQKSKELRERLMVSEATVQAQAEQLKDYRELLTETAVQQDSKHVQVDLQDLGYETCGRSENEAEREDASSPEFDDLEMLTSLDCGSQWWPANTHTTHANTHTNTRANTHANTHSTNTHSNTHTTGTSTSTLSKPVSTPSSEASSLQRLVEDLRSQLSRSQAVIRGLQSRLRSLSTSSDSTPRKVNWSMGASEDDEGWQSSDGANLASPRHQGLDGGGGVTSPLHPDKGMRELASRVDKLEDQLRQGGKKTVSEEGKAATWPGKFDTLIQTQARELSVLRQRLREGRGVCSILTQHQTDTTKAFEELLRANDIDYYMGQSFREQLAHGGALAQRVAAKISGRGDHPEDPDEKTELLAIRLSKELQQKDKVIESLRAKLNQHHNHHHHRSDTPTSSHAPSDTSDQSDRISYVSDDQGSTNQELEICSEGDAASEMGGKETRSSTRLSTDCLSHSGSHHTSITPSISSCLSSPSMHCSNNVPHTQADMHSHTAPALSFHPPPPHPPASLYPPIPRQPSYHGDGGAGFSLAEVHQELQMLQRQLAHSDNRFSTPQSRPIQGYPFSQPPPDPSAFLPFSFHGYSGYQPSPFNTVDNGTGIKASGVGAGLLESNALWDMTYGSRPMRMGADISSGSSGYQSGTSNTGSDLMKEHLREIRSLRQRLEDSIQTNERLRHQLEDRLARSTAEKGAPTNIYIQGLDSVGQLSSEIRLLKGLDSVGQLSSEIRLLKEENLSLHSQLRQAAREGSEEAERDRAKLKEAELQAEKWEGLSRKQEAEADSHNQEITQLKQERQRNQEAINRLQHEVVVLQQQLTESRGLVLSLQSELTEANTHTAGKASAPLDPLTSTFDPRELQTQLEQQLNGKTRSRRRLFNENVSSPPVRDTGLISPSSPLRHRQADNHDSVLEGSCPDGSFSDRHGRHAVGHVDDFRALQQQIREGGALLGKMAAALVTLTTTTKDYSYQFSLHQSPDYGSSVRKLMSETKTLREVLQEADSLLHMFWRAKLPNGQDNKDQALREEVVSLRLKLSDRDAALQVAMERVKSSDRTKESMEHFIVNQLSRTRDVLSKAKTNLQLKAPEVSVNCPSLLVGVS